MTTNGRLNIRRFILAASFSVCLPCASAQAPATPVTPNAPGQFDYFLLDMPWGPAFCTSIKDVSADCRPQQGFIVHGLWPQNNNGTWPQFCGQTPAPTDLATHLVITPDLALLKHEWDKHGTCSGLDPQQFFAAEHVAFSQVITPLPLIHLNDSRTYTPLMALNLFYVSNPAFPAGSFNLSCKEGHVTAVEACFDKSLKPIQCQGLKSCNAPTVTFDAVPQQH